MRLNRVASAAARDEGIHRVELATDPIWRRDANIACYKVLPLVRLFINDMVWATGLRHHVKHDGSTENRALTGPVSHMRKRGLIVSTGLTMGTTKVSSHRNGNMTIWRSLRYQPGLIETRDEELAGALLRLEALAWSEMQRQRDEAVLECTQIEDLF